MTNYNQGPYITTVPMTVISSFDPYPSGPSCMEADALLARCTSFHPKTRNNPHHLLAETNDFNNSLNAAMGLAGEGGEICDLFKKKLYGTLKPINREDLVKELGDLYWYFHSMLVHQQISLEEVLEANMAKLAQRYGVQL